MASVERGAHGAYRLLNIEGETYVLFQQEDGLGTPETRRTTVDLVTHTPNGVVLTYVAQFYGYADAEFGAIHDYEQRRDREQQDTIKRALGPMAGKAACYSDHNEDIRTKGSCDFCGGSAPNEG